MKIDRLTLTAFSPAFPGTVDVVLRDLEPGLIAVVGDNGAGKTTFLEAGAGAIYRQMPSSDNADPVSYATSRESALVLEYSTAAGVFRSTLHLDGPKRQTDALLEQGDPATFPMGWMPLNDGKRSTYDEAIATRFPSFDLFINSSFAAQGRGDEFTRRKPSQRKDLFSEFLGQQHYGVMTKSAGAAADLCADAQLRVQVQIEGLERDTSAEVVAEIDRLAQELTAGGGNAELRKEQLAATLQDLESRSALAADQVAAFTAATDRVRTLDASQRGALQEQATLRADVARAQKDHEVEVARIRAKRDTDVADAEKRIAGNEQLRGRKAEIQASVAALATAETTLAAARAELATARQAQQTATEQRRTEERTLADLVTLEREQSRATADTQILSTVPCEGAGPFASCQFLVNAKAAEARLTELAAKLAPKAAVADRIAALTLAVDAAATTVAGIETRIAEAEAIKRTHAKNAEYAAPLAAAEARIAELTTAKTKALEDATELIAAAEARYTGRLQDLTTRTATVAAALATIEQDLAAAQRHLEATATGNADAVQLQGQLAAARAEWDQVTATLATVESRRADIERRRWDLAGKQTRLVELRTRKARIEQELVDWLDLQKAFAKGGLPDLEIDAAGPTISATTNAILQECFGPRFTVELVTQVASASGGLKDEFTVQVIDNAAAQPEWRDIKKFSGGQKTILQEALMCAIALYVNERSPMPIRTLWRDETGAALDGENAIRYVAMLRKVRELGGYHHVFFITHNPAAADQADAQIQVGGGTARIVLPPFDVQEAA